MNEKRQHSIGSDAAQNSSGKTRTLIAASLSIEPFEGSRLRLRRTRLRRIWVSEGVLVLSRHLLDRRNRAWRHAGSFAEALNDPFLTR